MKKTFFPLCLALVTLQISGCSRPIGASDYEVHEIGQANKVVEGMIVKKKKVAVRENPNEPGLASGVGAIAGTVAGVQFGKTGKGMFTGGALGGLVGAGIGYAIDQNTSTQAGIEYGVRILETNEMISVVQGLSPDLAVGSHVHVILDLSGKGRTRIVRA